MVAKPSRIGTSSANTCSGVVISTTAPTAAARTEAITICTKLRSIFGSCVRSLRTARNMPGISAVMLQAVVSSGDMPAAISAG
jgi:hypothetical protein